MVADKHAASYRGADTWRTNICFSRAGREFAPYDAFPAQPYTRGVSGGVLLSVEKSRAFQLIRNQSLVQPWAANDQYITVSGIADFLTVAFQLARRRV